MNRKKQKKTIWKIVMWIALIGCLTCFGFAGWYLWSSAQAQKEYEELQAQMAAEAEKETAEEVQEYTLEEIQAAEFTGEIEVDTPEPEIPEGVIQEAEENPIDFDKLAEINSELYAWIRIPNTNIDYPIAQHAGADQSFYLHHDMYQEPRFSGCIYSETLNQMDFSDPVTVLYGRNMKNGSMFQNLHLFRNAEFFEENEFIYIYTPDKIRIYQIFAVYPYDDRHILNSFDFTDEQVLEEYLKDCQNPRSMEALGRDDVEVSTDTPILTLSTCIGGRTEERLLVQAVLMYEKDGK